MAKSIKPIFSVLVVSTAAVLAFSSVPCSAASQASDPNTVYGACMAEAESNLAFAKCGGVLLQSQEARLNATWRAVYQKLDKSAKAALLDEQRAWIVFKDKSCGLYRGFSFGREGQVIDFYMCRATVLTDRINELREIGTYRGPPQ